MLHQTSSFLGGKMSDISAFLENVKMLENTIYNLIAEKTKKDAEFWRENMKSDMFLTSEQLLSYGLIDQII
jgi:ATP-dependent protease ClpP protease subunit